ncbi:MAG: tetratricopeptide repeat protein, partial [Thermomicrobiales bacterium]
FAAQSLAHYRALGDRDKQASACNILGLAARFQGDNERSIRYLEEALALWRAVGNARGITAVSIDEEFLPLARTQQDRRIQLVRYPPYAASRFGRATGSGMATAGVAATHEKGDTDDRRSCRRSRAGSTTNRRALQ